MATNPRFPEPRDRDRERLNADLRRNEPKSGFPWVVLALVVAAAILTAILIWMPRTPKAAMTPSNANVPPQPTGQQIQFSGAKMVPSAAGDEVALDALMTNVGETDVTGVAVNGQFMGADGKAVASIPSQVMLLDPASGNTNGLVQYPVPPNAQKPVRIVFDHVPAGWNHEVPALTITQVTAAGNALAGTGAISNTGRSAAQTGGQNIGNTGAGEAQRNKPRPNQPK